MRIRGVSMEVVQRSGEARSDIVVVSDDGSIIAIDCENSVIMGLCSQISHVCRDEFITNVDDGNSQRDATDDVTQRIEAQRENFESRRIFKDLFDNSEAGIIDYDFSFLFRLLRDLKSDGVLNLRHYLAECDSRVEPLVNAVRINNINAVAMRMLGISSLKDHIRPSINIGDVAEAIFLGETSMRRSEYVAFQGALIPIVYSLRVPGTEEEARRVPIVMIDLSDIKLAEAARQATLAKSKFLSSMSHEIRTPLNGVIGNLELLALTNLDNEQFELIDDADKASKALLGLVGNILDFSKIEAGKLTTEIGDISPAALVQEAVDVLHSVGRQKRIFITATFSPDVPCLVRGDAIRVRQILLNLIGNAVKFTDHGGVQVSLTASACDRDVCQLRFEVSDSGRGFDQSLASLLFEPFSQDPSNLKGSEGTGLGLSICKSLVEVFGGTIGCVGVPGEGATFWFTLPAAVVRRAPPVPHPDLNGIRVMVTGRGSEAAQSLEEYFRARAADVVSETHRAALAFALDQDSTAGPGIDVAVLVPEGHEDDGETARRLRDKHTVPLLYGDEQAPRRWLRQGFAAVISPDADAAYLDRNIRLLVGHAEARDRMVAQRAAVVSAFGPDIAGTRVLVLEDRLVNQAVIRKQLQKFGIDCELAANGINGLEILDHHAVDLVLCDCSMPQMNGYDFTRALRKREAENPGRQRVPVIALTANAFGEDADKCFEAGMDDFVSKPVTMDRLAAMLAKWLGLSRRAREHAGSLSHGVDMSLQAIDLKVLAEMLDTETPETLNEVLVEFLAAAGNSLAQVTAAVSSGRRDGIVAAAHGAKGEARCAAAVGLAEIYAELERSASGGDDAISRGMTARAAAELCRVENFIRSRIESPES